MTIVEHRLLSVKLFLMLIFSYNHPFKKIRTREKSIKGQFAKIGTREMQFFQTREKLYRNYNGLKIKGLGVSSGFTSEVAIWESSVE